jgi:hypothetical protein
MLRDDVEMAWCNYAIIVQYNGAKRCGAVGCGWYVWLIAVVDEESR